MPSPQVIEKLQALQVELEKTSIAIKHIDEATKVAKTAADILKQIPELIKELKSVEESHRKELQKLHKENVDEVVKQLNNLLTELKGKSKELSQVIEETQKIEKAIANYFSEIKKINFPERLDKIDNQISSINIGVGNIQTSIQRSLEKIEKGFDEASSHVEAKTVEIMKKITEYNKLLKTEIKTNRVIQLAGLTIIIAALIYIAIKA